MSDENKKFVKVENEKDLPKNSLPISFDKFVIEVKRGCGSPFITTGFTISLPDKPNDWVVVNERPWAGFASEDFMTKVLASILSGDELPSTDIVVKPLPRISTESLSSIK